MAKREGERLHVWTQATNMYSVGRNAGVVPSVAQSLINLSARTESLLRKQNYTFRIRESIAHKS